MLGENKNLSKICYITSFCIYALILYYGKTEGKGDNLFGVGLLLFYFLMPVSSFIIGLIINVKNGFLKFLYPFIFAALGIFISILVFPKISWAKDTWACNIPIFIGSGIGSLIWVFRSKEGGNRCEHGDTLY